MFVTCLPGDGYETASTEKVSQSEAETSTIDVAESTTSTTKVKRGMFMEVKGQEMNKAIYGDSDKGSVRGIPGQVLVNK